MTAVSSFQTQQNTKVVSTLDNLQVVRVNETTVMNTGIRAGQPTNLIHEVTYSDGSVAYRCSTCGKEFPRWNQVFAHRASHSTHVRKNVKDSVTKKRLSKANAILVLAQELTASYIEDPVDAAPSTEIESLKAELAEERHLRKKAESDLKKIRSLLSPS